MALAVDYTFTKTFDPNNPPVVSHTEPSDPYNPKSYPGSVIFEYRDEYGTRMHYFNGELHRTDGPAVEDDFGYKEYWLDGKLLTLEEFLERTS